MTQLVADSLTAFHAERLPQVRMASMFLVLAVALTAGLLAANRWNVPVFWARRLMTIVLVFFDSTIALLVIWQVELSRQVIWLPAIGLVIMLAMTGLGAVLFRSHSLDSPTRLTLILAGALSNTGYTGAAFVCYALFGTVGLALANIYLVFSVPTFYVAYLPAFKMRELRCQQRTPSLNWAFVLDPRCLVIPATIAAVILNRAGVPYPAFVRKLHIVDVLVYIASTMAFFAIGMQVHISRLGGYKGFYAIISAMKFVVTPALAAAMMFLLSLAGHGLTPEARSVIIVLSAAPCAVLMVTTSSVFGLNGPLAGALWVVTMAIWAFAVVPLLFLVFA